MSYQKIWDGRSGYGGKRRPLWRILLILLAAAVACFVALEIYIAVHSRTEIKGEPELMVIFGCQVKPWGPSELLQDRLDTALAYLKENPDMTIVVTGGKGDDEHQSEAQCMYDYLTAHGVSGERILLEDASRNTWQNVLYTKAILEEAEVAPQGVVVVSNGFHLSRIKLLWGRAWAGTAVEEVSTLAAPVSHAPSAVKMFFREPLALVKSFVVDR